VKPTEARALMRDALKSTIDEGELSSIIRIVFDFLKIDLLRTEVAEQEVAFIKEVIQRLSKHEPLQYILGEAWFYGLKFLVNQHVLIPRPETEELVDLMLKQLPVNNKLHLLDIGTGSGCIPISLAKNAPLWSLHGIDISTNALQVAQHNAELHKVNIRFSQVDILSEVQLPLPIFDVIVSNPPYILLNEKKEMSPTVWSYEPTPALFVTNNDPLQFYKAILHFASSHLTSNGLLFFETHVTYANEVAAYMMQHGYTNVQVVKDMQGNNRMVHGQKPARDN
jgi:release factor glutamine methyltransferase